MSKEKIILTADDFVDTDFVMVRPRLVRKFGNNANIPLVLGRIQFRCQVMPVDTDGHQWWKASYGDIAEETGLTADQCRRIVEKLLELEILVCKIDNDRAWDRTRSYRVDFRQMHLANSPDGSGEIATCNPANSPVLPSIQEGSNKRTNKPSRASRTRSDFSDIADQHFEEWYQAYPKRTAKIAAKKAYIKALSVLAADERVKSGQSTAVDILLCAAHSYAQERRGQDPQYTPAPSVWLNGGRWDDERLPQFVNTQNRNELIERDGMQLTRRNAEAVERMARLAEQNPDLLSLAAGTGSNGEPW